VDEKHATRTVTHVTAPDTDVRTVTDGDPHDDSLRARSSMTAR
jgi:hypothetical protein